MFKTLNQVEPRIPISPSDLPLTITAAGSYYLTQSIAYSTPNSNAIMITAGHVSIDLMGFTLQGPGHATGSTGSAIVTTGTTPANLSISNGVITEWRKNGIDLTSYGENSEIKNIRVQAVGNRGIAAGPFNSIENCMVEFCGDAGIFCGNSSIIANCLSYKNENGGLSISVGSYVRNSKIAANTGIGIFSPVGSIITDTVVTDSTDNGIQTGRNSLVDNCFVSTNSGAGIVVDFYCTVNGCTSLNNLGDAIQGTFQNRITSNNCTNNGIGNGGAGIHMSVGCTISDNNVTANAIGIKVDGASNFIVRNNALGNAAQNYLLDTPSNIVGPIATGLGTIFTTSPWANFSN